LRTELNQLIFEDTVYNSSLHGTDTLFFEVGSNLGINKLQKGEFKVYPNPVYNSLYINNESYQKPSEIIIYSTLGNVILKSINHQSKIDVSVIKPGIYFMSIGFGQLIKFIKK